VIFDFWLRYSAWRSDWGGVRDRDGIPVRHPLEVLSRCSGPIQGSTPDVRDLPPSCSRLFLRVLILAAAACAVRSICLDRDVTGGPSFRLSGLWSLTDVMQVPKQLCREKWRLRSERLIKISSNRWCGRDFRKVLMGSYLTGAFCVARDGAWYVCGGNTTRRSA